MDALVMKDKTQVIPVEERGGIQVMKTHDHKLDIKCLDSLLELGEEVKNGTSPPVVSVENLEHRAAGSEPTPRGKSMVACAIKAVLYATVICALAVSTMVINESKLTADQRAWLWHWRLGHPDWNAPIEASKVTDKHDALVIIKPNVDCFVCDKAKFKTGTFKRNQAKFKTGTFKRDLVDNDDAYDPPF